MFNYNIFSKKVIQFNFYRKAFLEILQMEPYLLSILSFFIQKKNIRKKNNFKVT